MCVISGGNPHLWQIFNLVGPVEANLVFLVIFCIMSSPIVGGGGGGGGLAGPLEGQSRNQFGDEMF